MLSPPPRPLHRPCDARFFDHRDRLVASARAESLRILDLGVPEDPPELARALHYVHERLFDHDLTASAVHRAVGAPRLRVQLRRTVGAGIRVYIERARLFVATRLLRVDGVELYVVADAVGYAQYETFCRAFKRSCGRPPSAVRAAFRQTETSSLGVKVA